MQIYGLDRDLLALTTSICTKAGLSGNG